MIKAPSASALGAFLSFGRLSAAPVQKKQAAFALKRQYLRIDCPNQSRLSLSQGNADWKRRFVRQMLQVCCGNVISLNPGDQCQHSDCVVLFHVLDYGATTKV